MKTGTKNLPKDLQVRIGTKEEVFWTELRDKIQADILQAQRQIMVNLKIQEFAEEKIAKEQKV